ncbi:hypothetical protein RRG08_018605 [Elysia crispata]|uniref:Uncharacterized protein n=1 Tax=Elysia crispata TaxID=231223 RepID=A0AAE1B546_9GAST|nr:hypothetical protein RRG08_018605 [Elysia crispata]
MYRNRPFAHRAISCAPKQVLSSKLTVEVFSLCALFAQQHEEKSIVFPSGGEQTTNIITASVYVVFRLVSAASHREHGVRWC